MKKVESPTLLVLCQDEALYDRCRAAAPEATECLRAESGERASLLLAERLPDLVLIEHGFEGDAEGLVRRLRGLPGAASCQFLVVARAAAGAEIALLAGFDAALLGGASSEEFRLAIRAAFLRRRRIAALVAERDYLGAAVRREEGLSRRLLEHHIALESALAKREGSVAPAGAKAGATGPAAPPVS